MNSDILYNKRNHSPPKCPLPAKEKVPRVGRSLNNI